MAGESAREVARRSREKAERLQRRAEMFERGADGEEATAHALAALPPGWLTIHDVRWPSRRLANIDHIVIGPGGVFVVDSKNWSGSISVEDSRLRQNGRSREQTVAGAADAALAIAELIAPYARYVAPVLCFVGQQRIHGWARDVMVCSADNLHEMLTTRPIVLAAEDVTDVWFRLDVQLRSAAGRQPESTTRPSSSRRPSLSSAATARRSRGTTRPHSRRPANGRGSFARFLAGVALLMAFAFGVGPSLSTSLGGFLAGMMTRDLNTPGSCSSTAVPTSVASGPVATTGSRVLTGKTRKRHAASSGRRGKRPHHAARPRPASSTTAGNEPLVDQTAC